MLLLGGKLHLQKSLLERRIPGEERHLVRASAGIYRQQEGFIFLLNGAEGIGGDLFHALLHQVVENRFVPKAVRFTRDGDEEQALGSHFFMGHGKQALFHRLFQISAEDQREHALARGFAQIRNGDQLHGHIPPVRMSQCEGGVQVFRK